MSKQRSREEIKSSICSVETESNIFGGIRALNSNLTLLVELALDIRDAVTKEEVKECTRSNFLGYARKCTNLDGKCPHPHEVKPSKIEAPELPGKLSLTDAWETRGVNEDRKKINEILTFLKHYAPLLKRLNQENENKN